MGEICKTTAGLRRPGRELGDHFVKGVAEDIGCASDKGHCGGVADAGVEALDGVVVGYHVADAVGAGGKVGVDREG